MHGRDGNAHGSLAQRFVRQVTNQPCFGLKVTITTKTFHEKVVYGENDNSGGVVVERIVTNSKSTQVVPKATQNT